MRDQEIVQIIERNQLPPDGGTYYRGDRQFANLGDLRSRINALLKIPGLSSWAVQFRVLRIFNSDLASMQTTGEEAGITQAALDKFANHVGGILALSKARVGKQSENSIFVKLPTSDSINTTAAFLIRIDKSLGQLVYHPKVNGTVSLRSWETGSLWMEIVLGSGSVVAIVAAATWAAAVIRKKMIEGDAMVEHVNALKLNNEAKKQVVAAQAQLISDALEIEAKNVIDQYLDSDPDPETLPRIIHVIREFSEMIAQGAEIHPALAAPEEVSNLFPPLASLLTLQSKVPELARNREASSGDLTPNE